MKTSNKLLIALAIILLTIPLTVMILIAKANRIDNKTYSEMLMKAESTNSDIDRFIKNYEFGKFQNVVINGSDLVYLDVKIIKSDKFLIKTTNVLADVLKHEVDKNGKLSLSFTSKGNYLHGTLLIFSPNLKGIVFNNVSINELAANTDSLNVEISKSNSFKFGKNANIKNLNLTKKADHSENNAVVTNITIEDAKIDNLKAEVNNGYLIVNNMQLKQVVLMLKDAKTEFNNEEDKNFKPIENLTLNSVGPNAINFHNVKINMAKGSISDGTNIQIPTINLKQLINK
ncbi:hypothetical protein [Pedobacter soli]|uniref:Adhesin domain-containing protein n=1 Tax=Pedobacter soli TaxID=390242 RepID=A0A1G6UN53_9SPHI|nr:hypothetical protein [Pedobacter soli]SDD42166.1 hypothetical protein SAMN04488024_105386 [Pedobacter soli]